MGRLPQLRKGMPVAKGALSAAEVTCGTGKTAQRHSLAAGQVRAENLLMSETGERGGIRTLDPMIKSHVL